MCNKKTEEEDIKDIPHKELEKTFGIPEHPEIPETNNQESVELGQKKETKKTS